MIEGIEMLRNHMGNLKPGCCTNARKHCPYDVLPIYRRVHSPDGSEVDKLAAEHLNAFRPAIKFLKYQDCRLMPSQQAFEPCAEAGIATLLRARYSPINWR